MSEDLLFDIPPTWRWAPLGEIAEVKLGKMLSDKAFEPGLVQLPYLRNQNVRWGSIDYSDVKTMGFKESELERYSLKPGDLLVCEGGEPGRCALYNRAAGELMYQKALHRIRPYGGFVLPRYLQLCLWNYVANGLVIPRPSQTTIQHLPRERMLKLPIPVAPLAEQERIVSELEKQFTRLDFADATLAKVSAGLKRYRASVLKAAVEGRLVPTEAELARVEGRGYEPADHLLLRIKAQRRALWEAKTGKDRDYTEPVPPDVSDLSQLPEGWTWVTWEQIGFCQNGRLFPSSEYQRTGIRLLRPGNLAESGTLVWNEENTRFLPEHWVHRHPEHLVGPGELIMNLTAQSLKDEFLGRICLTGCDERCLLNQRLARLTPVEVSSRYLLWLFKSPIFRRFVDGLNKGSLIQHMFTSQIMEFRLPLPPLSEQLRIAHEIERRLSLLNAIAETTTLQVKRSEKLRQSILNSAFVGKLVAQDPSDEPASALLEQIRKAQESAADVRPRRGRGVTPVSETGEVSEAPRGHRDKRTFLSASETPHGVRRGASLQWGGDEIAPSQTASQDFLDLSRDEQIDHAWECLLGHGSLDKDAAIRTAAQSLRDLGLARFQRLREGGPLYETIAAALDRGVREGSFDRPKRGQVRAILPDAKAYTSEEWKLCLLQSLDGEPVSQDDALRTAAEWARETLGLDFTRLREDGVILTGLRAALEEAVKGGEVIRRREGVALGTGTE